MQYHQLCSIILINWTYENVKEKYNKVKNSTVSWKLIRNVSIADSQIIVSLNDISLYKNIPIIDKLNIIKDYLNNDSQFTREMGIPLGKFLDLANLVLATACMLLIISFTNKLMTLQREEQYFQPQQQFMCRLMNK